MGDIFGGLVIENKTFSFEIWEIRREGAREREGGEGVNQCVRDGDTGSDLKPWTSPATMRSKDLRFQ